MNDRYGIGPRLRMFAETATNFAQLRQIALAEMEVITTKYDETVNLAVSSGRDIVYIQMTRGSRMQPMRAKIGEHHPLHSTAAGKAILAFLPPGEGSAIMDAPLDEMTLKTIQSAATLRRQLKEIQRKGYSVERQETEIGLSCVGVPVFDKTGYPIAALSLTALDKRLMSALDVAQLDLKDAATAISNQLIQT